MCVCVYTCICAYTCVYYVLVYIYIYIYTYIYIYIYICIHTYANGALWIRRFYLTDQDPLPRPQPDRHEAKDELAKAGNPIKTKLS